MTPTIEARGLVKRFGKVAALDGLDVIAEPGQVTALLGPNGAGKTTFVRAVATLIRPDSGELRVCGYDVTRAPGAVRRSIGLAGQHAAIEPALTGLENLTLVGRLYGMSRREAKARASRVIDQFGLGDAADRPARGYSGGMRRRLDLAASMVGRPRLLLLDEPTTGLDPRSRIGLWDEVRRLVRAGTDVLLTTQYLEEADRLADRVVIIDRGHVVAAGTPEELKDRVGGRVVELHVRRAAEVDSAARALETLGIGSPRADAADRRLTLSVDGGEARLTTVLRSVEDAGVDVDDLTLRAPTLDEVFLALTGRPSDQPTRKDSNA